MAHRTKNLLEAFKASSQEEKPKVLPLRPAGPAPKADDPFAEETRPLSGPGAGLHESPGSLFAGSAAEGAPRRAAPALSPALSVALGALAVLVAFWLGRLTARPAAAGGTEGVASQTAPAPAPSTAQVGTPAGVQPPGSGQLSQQVARTPAESALLDTRNQYTIKVVEYARNRDEPLARQTEAYLLKQGLPAVSTYMGARLYILVDATPPPCAAARSRSRTRSM